MEWKSAAPITVALPGNRTGVDEVKVEELRQARQYEQLEMLILNALTGRKD